MFNDFSSLNDNFFTVNRHENWDISEIRPLIQIRQSCQTRGHPSRLPDRCSQNLLNYKEQENRVLVIRWV
jgi:hypothetical protein